MTKYKWSLLGLIISSLLFIAFLISPLAVFIDTSIKRIPAEPVPEYIQKALAETSSLLPSQEKLNKVDIEDRQKYIEQYENRKAMAKKFYYDWYRTVPKKIDWHAFREALGVFGKSFITKNLFWIPVIIFSFLVFNYRKERQ